jgi:hypothetical protein
LETTGVDVAEVADAAEEGVELDADDGCGCMDLREYEEWEASSNVREDRCMERRDWSCSRTGASESERSGEASKSGDARATSSRKAVSFLSHMPSSTLSALAEMESRDWMLLKRWRMLPQRGVLLSEGELGVGVGEVDGAAAMVLLPSRSGDLMIMRSTR